MPLRTGYLYDADGARVAKGTITTMSCDPTTNGFQITESYVLGPGGEEISMLDGTNTWQRTNVYVGGRLTATYDQAGLHFHLSDPLGTRRVQLSGNLTSGNQTQPLGQPELDCQSLPYGDQQSCTPAPNAPPTSDDATPLHFTGKERDAESGNDYFGARYYASTMGRFMSPDPGNIGVKIANPQTWNMYSYGLNNPLTITDPTGMYVCEDSTDCSSQNDQNFAQSLANAQSAANNMTGSDQAAAQRAIDAYGAQGVDNGVNVRFDSNVSGGVTEVSGVANGNKSADNPNGQNINVTFNPNAAGGNFDGSLVAHEGSHVADGSDWVKSGFSSSMNPTHNTTEVNANHVQFNILNVQLNAMYPGGYTGTMYGGSVGFKNGDTFKMITPDLQKAIQKENGAYDTKPAFTKGGVLQP